MYISKKDALAWFEFFAQLPEGEALTPRQEEIALAVLSQIERAQMARIGRMLNAIPNLRQLGTRTDYVGDDARFPKGCHSCLMGTGLGAVRKTNRCNLNCPFCYDFGEMDCQPPIGDGYWEIGGGRFREEDIPLLLATAQEPPTGIAYVYLEPFMEIDKYYGIIRRFHEAGVYQHMYTNGTMLTWVNARKLAEAGLDELRFNLGATNCSDPVIEHIAMAKEFIPMVGVESPMTPDLYDGILKKKDRLLETGLDFINCAELHLNPNNLQNYLGEPMYIYRLGYLSPTWSRVLTLKLMRRAAEENWPVTIHDCSNATKFARDLNLRAHEGGWFGATGWGMEFPAIPFEALLPTLRDPDFHFLREDPLPEGYGIGEGMI